VAGNGFVKNIDEEEVTYNLQLTSRYLRDLKRMEGGEMSLERKRDGEAFCRIRYGGTWQRNVLKFMNLGNSSRTTCLSSQFTFHALNLDARSMPSTSV